MGLKADAMFDHVLQSIRSEGVPTFMAVVLVLLYGWLVVDGRDIPSGLDTLVGLVVAYYFVKRTDQRAAHNGAVAVLTEQRIRNGGSNHG